MDEFERELARALGRVKAPEGFAAKVFAASTEGEAAEPKVLAWPMRRRWLSGALAASLALAAASESWHVHRLEQRRTAAEAEFATAMRVTDRALEQTREQLSRSGVPLFNQ